MEINQTRVHAEAISLNTLSTNEVKMKKAI